MKRYLISAVLFLLSLLAAAQETKPAQPVVHSVLCGTLIHPGSGQVQHNVVITVEGERVRQIQEGGNASSNAQIIDLSDRTCLPGPEKYLLRAHHLRR